jgi:hypothetical protein
MFRCKRDMLAMRKIKKLMAWWLARVKQVWQAMSVPLVKAMQHAEWPAQQTRQVRAPKASQPVEPRQVLENRREQVKSPRRETAPVV